MEEKSNYTIEDVAKVANVAKSTVSRVLNNSGPVSKKTRDKVLNSIKQLNYRPNQIAKSLSENSTNLIGLLVPDIKNPFYSRLSWHVETEFEKKGYKIVICNTSYSANKEKKYLHMLLDQKVNGIILASCENIPNIIETSKNTSTPYMVIGRFIDKTISVSNDNILGGEIATKHLIDLGHRDIAFITSDFSQAERNRKKGYLKALKGERIKINEKYIICQSDEELRKNNYSAILELLSCGNPPTAVFASNDFKALQIINVLNNNSYKVPQEISVIGYDNINFASFVNLTTVCQPIDQMIKYIVSAFTDNSNNEKKIFSPRLIVRNTTGKRGER